MAHVVKTTPDSINLRWEVLDDGRSPINKAVINYKMTYGEWASQEVSEDLHRRIVSAVFCVRYKKLMFLLVKQ